MTEWLRVSVIFYDNQTTSTTSIVLLPVLLCYLCQHDTVPYAACDDCLNCETQSKRICAFSVSNKNIAISKEFKEILTSIKLLINIIVLL